MRVGQRETACANNPPMKLKVVFSIKNNTNTIQHISSITATNNASHSQDSNTHHTVHDQGPYRHGTHNHPPPGPPHAPTISHHVARSSQPVDSVQLSRSKRFATVPLKVCIALVCYSRPDLIPDQHTDYALSSLAPDTSTAEAPSSIHRCYSPPSSSSSPHPSRGRARANVTSHTDGGLNARTYYEGKGMMGWVLEEKGAGQTRVMGRVVEEETFGDDEDDGGQGMHIGGTGSRRDDGYEGVHRTTDAYERVLEVVLEMIPVSVGWWCCVAALCACVCCPAVSCGRLAHSADQPRDNGASRLPPSLRLSHLCPLLVNLSPSTSAHSTLLPNIRDTINPFTRELTRPPMPVWSPACATSVLRYHARTL